MYPTLTSPAFSFRYADAASAELLPRWSSQSRTAALPDGSRVHVSWTDPVTGLVVALHLRHFSDSPAVDWLLEFANQGSTDTPILEDILPLDLSIPASANERLRLHHANGSSCRMDDFLPHLTELPPASQVTLAPVGGRSSSGALPFFNLQRAAGGLLIAIGWSGQWALQLTRDASQLRVSAGMQRTHLRLHPGEVIRTPRMLLLPWEGDQAEIGQNALRQLLLAHYLPRQDGQLWMPPVAQCLQFYFYLTGQASEVFEMTALPKAADLGCDAYWIDACWFGGEKQWWEEVGSWEVNRQRFPHGLRPISDAAHKAGMKFVLWFEPERARPDSRLPVDHPEFFLHSPHDPSNLLLDLGNPVALAYLTDLLSNRIAEYGVDIYRQDFNFDPLPYWQTADAPDRLGMAEIGHITGLYALWDELRRRHPGLWIDNCASGGRRIDLETLSRSLPLWPSDFTDTIGLPYGLDLHVGDQCINAGLACWTPLFGGGVWNFTPYAFRSQILGGFTFGCHIDHAYFIQDDASLILSPNEIMARGETLLGDDFPLAQARQAIAELHSLRPYLLGNFYPLLPLTVSNHDWCAWQLHRPDLRSGVALVFRRHCSPFPQMQLNLREIDPLAEYMVSLSPNYAPVTVAYMSGQTLLALTVSIAEQPGSLLIRYRQLPG